MYFLGFTAVFLLILLICLLCCFAVKVPPERQASRWMVTGATVLQLPLYFLISIPIYSFGRHFSPCSVTCFLLAGCVWILSLTSVCLALRQLRDTGADLLRARPLVVAFLVFQILTALLLTTGAFPHASFDHESYSRVTMVLAGLMWLVSVTALGVALARLLPFPEEE